MRLVVLISLYLSTLVTAQNIPRVFSEGYIEGLYGRFFEYTQGVSRAQCPQVIDHYTRGYQSAMGGSWIVPHDKITMNGALCDIRGMLVLNPYSTRSLVPRAIGANKIAHETFLLMKRESTGFWMGADSRTCGKWYFPNPSYVFFVKEFDRDITTSFRLKLYSGKKYMFIVATDFACIYQDVARRTSTPGVTITIPNIETSPRPGLGGDGSSDGDQTTSPSGGSSDSPTVISGSSASSSGSDSGTSSGMSSDVGSGAGSGSGTGISPESPSNPDAAQSMDSANPETSPSPDSASSGTSMSPIGDSGSGTIDLGSDSTEPGASSEAGSALNPSIIDIAAGAKPPASQESTPGQSILDIDEDTAAGDDDHVLTVSENSSDGDSMSGDPDASLDIEESESVCFPADATVELADGSVKMMSEIAIGDELLVGDTFSSVFLFTHRDSGTMHKFIRLSTLGGREILLTRGHFIYVNGNLISAEKAEAGAAVRLADGSADFIIVVSTVVKRGLYNPQTLHGDIVVNGIVASTYTTAVQPRAAHTLLTPLRAFCRVHPARILSNLFDDASSCRRLLWWYRRLPPAATKL